MPDVALDIVTDFVLPNEVCMGMRQGPVGDRWLLYIFVVRGDTIAKHITDCGPASLFERIPVEVVPGDGETTVSEFMDEGERHRNDLFAWNDLQRVKAESTLMQDVAEQRVARREHFLNRTVIGPYQTTQRNIYSRAKTLRKIRDGATR